MGGGIQESSASFSHPLPQCGGWRGSPTLSPLPSRLPLPVQPMGLGIWLPPCLRIVSSVMYIHTHAPLLGRTRQGEGTRAAGWRGFITRLLNLNLSPPGMGVLMAPEALASRKSGNQSLHRLARGLPSLLPHSPLLLPGTASHPFTSAASADLGAAMGPFAFKYPDAAPMGAAAGRWGAREQGLECASEGMATGLTSRKCCRRSLQGGRGSGGGWQPGGQLSCEQMTSAAAIALGRTK